MKVNTVERCFRLRERRLQRAQIAQAVGPAGPLDDGTVKLNDFTDRQVAHQAKRRYNSWFLRSTRSAAARNSSSRFASKSATAARARSDGGMPSRSASSCSLAASAGGKSNATFILSVYPTSGSIVPGQSPITALPSSEIRKMMCIEPPNSPYKHKDRHT